MEASFGRTPPAESLGYEAALMAGLAAADAGASELAVSYLERATALRPTGVALVTLAKALRDLGRLESAEVRYREALILPGRSRSHALVGLAAVLCDLREYEEALELAREAVDLTPANPAALITAARCIEELADTLAQGATVDPDALATVRDEATTLRARALELEPKSAEDRLQQRRDRAFPLHTVLPAPEASDVSIEQAAGIPLRRGIRDEPEPAEPEPAEELQGSATAAKPLFAQLRRWLHVMFRRAR